MSSRWLVSFELHPYWAYGFRTRAIFCLWASSLINVAPMIVELNRSWAYGCRTWAIFDLWMSSSTNVGFKIVELNQSCAYENELEYSLTYDCRRETMSPPKYSKCLWATTHEHIHVLWLLRMHAKMWGCARGLQGSGQGDPNSHFIAQQ